MRPLITAVIRNRIRLTPARGARGTTRRPVGRVRRRPVMITATIGARQLAHGTATTTIMTIIGTNSTVTRATAAVFITRSAVLHTQSTSIWAVMEVSALYAVIIRSPCLLFLV
jgi:hypothetical protein